MHTIKVKFTAGEKAFVIKDGKPVEDKIIEVKVSITEKSTEITFDTEESGLLNAVDLFETKREIAIKLGYIEPITRTKKVKSPIGLDGDVPNA